MEVGGAERWEGGGSGGLGGGVVGVVGEEVSWWVSFAAAATTPARSSREACIKRGWRAMF